jgi:hypothetical protein
MTSELREIFLLTDKTTIEIRTQYIRGVANIWTDKLGKETDASD